MKLAFLITAYKYPDQLARLTRRLATSFPGCSQHVHVDAKYDVVPFVAATHPDVDVQFLRSRQKVHWGAFSATRAIGLLADAALASGCDRAVLLSEQCYPIRPAAELVALFEENADREFVDARLLRTEWPAALARFDRYYFPDVKPDWVCNTAERVANTVLPRREPPDDLELYGGSTWWSLTRDALEHLRAPEKRARADRFFRTTACADEAYVQTIMMNEPRFASRIAPLLTYVRFDRAVSTDHPVVWTTAELPELAASGCFFARKFDERIDVSVLDALDALIETGIVADAAKKGVPGQG
ncbi:MAG TPA: beta-1,6-N-acetylglucosaminyltransferase [Acidimicrobiia bacterium]